MRPPPPPEIAHASESLPTSTPAEDRAPTESLWCKSLVSTSARSPSRPWLFFQWCVSELGKDRSSLGGDVEVPQSVGGFGFLTVNRDDGSLVNRWMCVARNRPIRPLLFQFRRHGQRQGKNPHVRHAAFDEVGGLCDVLAKHEAISRLLKDVKLNEGFSSGDSAGSESRIGDCIHEIRIGRSNAVRDKSLRVIRVGGKEDVQRCLLRKLSKKVPRRSVRHHDVDIGMLPLKSDLDLIQCELKIGRRSNRKPHGGLPIRSRFLLCFPVTAHHDGAPERRQASRHGKDRQPHRHLTDHRRNLSTRQSVPSNYGKVDVSIAIIGALRA